MTDQEILAIAHRTATVYRHRSDPESPSYGFVNHTIIDFARKVEQAATNAALERAAKVCEKLGTATNGIYERNQECAEAIRALKDAE